MLSKEEIISNSISTKEPVKCGVYFLIGLNKKIVYIGVSQDLHKRLRKHMANPELRFCRYFFIEYKSFKDAMRDEILYINQYKPFYNIDYNPTAIEEMNHAIELEPGNLQIKTLLSGRKTLCRNEVIGVLFRNGVETKLYKRGSVNSREVREMRQAVCYAINDY